MLLAASDDDLPDVDVAMLLLSATLYGDVCIVLLAASDDDLPLMMICLTLMLHAPALCHSLWSCSPGCGGVLVAVVLIEVRFAQTCGSVTRSPIMSQANQAAIRNCRCCTHSASFAVTAESP